MLFNVEAINPSSTNGVILKCGKESEGFRKKGNQYFCQKNSWKALENYSQSVLNATTDSECLALAYGNRSAALFELGYYEESLRDIERCLRNEKFPASSRYKLESRRLKCIAKLGQSKLMHDVNRLTLYLSRTEIDCDRKSKVLAEAEALLSKNGYGIPVTRTVQTANLWPGCSANVPNLSSAVRIAFSASEGRFLVANESISPGAAVIVERPYASLLLQHMQESYCHDCHKLLPLDVVPCQHCNQVRYCSEICRDSSWDTYHWLECDNLDFLYRLGIAHLALRIILVTRLEDIIQYCCCDHVEPPAAVCSTESYSSNYESIYNLVSHHDQLDPEDVAHYQATASILVECLWRKQYITKLKQHISSARLICDQCKNVDSVQKTLLLCVDKLLLRHIEQLICNAHAITSVVSTASKTYPSHVLSVYGRDIDVTDQVRVASAIYPVASLMNHSCEPNIFSSFIGSTLVVRAVKPIPLGGQLLNCYGPHAGRMLRVDRQANLLQQYHFTCKCVACCDSFNKEATYSAFQCKSCQGAMVPLSGTEGMCLDCKLKGCCFPSEIDGVLDTLMETFDDAKGVANALYKLEQVLFRHNKRLSAARDHVSRLLAEVALYKDAESLLTKNLESICYYYGAQSIELANELQKLVDVQVSLLEQSLRSQANGVDSLLRTMKSNVKQAIEIFTIHYGADCPQVADLSHLRRVLDTSKNKT